MNRRRAAMRRCVRCDRYPGLDATGASKHATQQHSAIDRHFMPPQNFAFPNVERLALTQLLIAAIKLAIVRARCSLMLKIRKAIND
jgi:hypothetical protein